jgi:hypothetical protein
VFNVLSKEARPMTGRRIAQRIMEAHQRDPQDMRRLKAIECGLKAVLGRMEGHGVVRVGSGRPKRWMLEGFGYPGVLENTIRRMP